MKQLQKSDLKVSEIYKLKAHNREYLYRISDMRTSMTLCNDGYLIIDTNHFNKISNISQSHDFADAKYIETKNKYEFYNATPEEKHWLETCINADQFVSYEEAMKTFIPEYYEYIGRTNAHSAEFIKGKTYKIVNKNNLEAAFNFINEKGIANGCSGSNWKYFKPSTKEAYEAQFVVKEKLQEPKDKVLEKEGIDLNIGKIIRVESSEGAIYQLGDKIQIFGGFKNSMLKNRNYLTIIGFRWNSNKTSIYAITELYGTNGIGLDKIELYIEPKVKVKDDFVLPEKWCIKSGENLVLDYCNENGINSYSKSELQANYAHFPSYDNCTTCSYILKGYTEITFEQFKKYVLKDE